MNSISFFTPVVYTKSNSDLSEGMLEIVDNLLSLNGKQAIVIQGQKVNGKELVLLTESNPSLLATIGKVALYFTVIIPLILLAIKCVLRTTHQFYTWPEKETPTAAVFLRAYRGQLISDPQELGLLKLSMLNEQQIRTQFGRDSNWSYYGKKPSSAEVRFSHLSGSEVHKALYKDIVPNHLYDMITQDQLKGLDISRLTSGQVQYLLYPNSNSSARTKELLALFPVRTIQMALYEDKLPSQIFPFIPLEVVKTLDLNRLNSFQINELLRERGDNEEKYWTGFPSDHQLKTYTQESLDLLMGISNISRTVSGSNQAELQLARDRAQNLLTLVRLSNIPITSIIDARESHKLNNRLFDKVPTERFEEAFYAGKLNSKQIAIAFESGKLRQANLQGVFQGNFHAALSPAVSNP